MIVSGKQSEPVQLGGASMLLNRQESSVENSSFVVGRRKYPIFQKSVQTESSMGLLPADKYMCIEGRYSRSFVSIVED